MVKKNSPTAATPMDSLKPYTSQMVGGSRWSCLAGCCCGFCAWHYSLSEALPPFSFYIFCSIIIFWEDHFHFLDFRRQCLFIKVVDLGNSHELVQIMHESPTTKIKVIWLIKWVFLSKKTKAITSLLISELWRSLVYVLATCREHHHHLANNFQSLPCNVLLVDHTCHLQLASQKKESCNIDCFSLKIMKFDDGRFWTVELVMVLVEME